MIVFLLKPAEQELLDATLYYEAHLHGLGEEFLRKIASALSDVAQNPMRWPVIRADIRRRLVHRFPYAVLYRVDPDQVVVVAIAHLHRHPHYWTART